MAADHETYVYAPVTFPMAQITSGENRLNPQPGDPSVPLSATGAEHVAMALNGHAQRSQEDHETFVVSPALTSEGHDSSEDGTGRHALIVAASLTAGGHPNSSAPGRHREDDENLVAGTLGTNGRNRSQGPADYVAQDWRVRRLTPMERCRLQGFPDDWLAGGNGPPVGPKEAATGDAVTVNVAEWIGLRLREAVA